MLKNMSLSADILFMKSYVLLISCLFQGGTILSRNAQASFQYNHVWRFNVLDRLGQKRNISSQQIHRPKCFPSCQFFYGKYSNYSHYHSKHLCLYIKKNDEGLNIQFIFHFTHLVSFLVQNNDAIFQHSNRGDFFRISTTSIPLFEDPIYIHFLSEKCALIY